MNTQLHTIPSSKHVGETRCTLWCHVIIAFQRATSTWRKSPDVPSPQEQLARETTKLQHGVSATKPIQPGSGIHCSSSYILAKDYPLSRDLQSTLSLHTSDSWSSLEYSHSFPYYSSTHNYYTSVDAVLRTMYVSMDNTLCTQNIYDVNWYQDWVEQSR